MNDLLSQIKQASQSDDKGLAYVKRVLNALELNFGKDVLDEAIDDRDLDDLVEIEGINLQNIAAGR